MHKAVNERSSVRRWTRNIGASLGAHGRSQIIAPLIISVRLARPAVGRAENPDSGYSLNCESGVAWHPEGLPENRMRNAIEMFPPQLILGILVDDAFAFALIYRGQGISHRAIFGCAYIALSLWTLPLALLVYLWNFRFCECYLHF
jgi:hypothetical protein